MLMGGPRSKSDFKDSKAKGSWRQGLIGNSTKVDNCHW